MGACPPRSAAPDAPGISMSQAHADTVGGESVPWQLKMFSKTLKKQQKLALLLEHLHQKALTL